MSHVSYHTEESIARGILYFLRISILSLANFIGTGHCFIDARVGEARNTLADSTKAKTILGWVPTKNIFEYISEEINKDQNTDAPE